MYNVEFGDAFLLYENEENLLVDLGSIKSDFNFVPIRKLIKADCNQKEFSFLLTHFHKDHWSGLLNQTTASKLPAVKTVYLPDIFGTRYAKQIDIIVRSLISEFFQSIILDVKLSFTLADLLHNILPSLASEQITFLARDSTFFVGKKKYKVLWPSVQEKDIVMEQDTKLRYLIEQLNKLLAESGWDYNLLETLDKTATALLVKFARNINHALQDDKWEIQEEFEVLNTRMGLAAESLSKTLKTPLANESLKTLRSSIQYYIKALDGNWNDISLVFHEMETGEVLMTGDIPRNTLKKLIHGEYGNPKLKEKYLIIKAPHHGTETHFCALLPPCRHYCISNGAGNKNYGEISELYEYVYGCLGKGSRIICTNPSRCEFLRRNVCPTSRTCPCRIYYDI